MCHYRLYIFLTCGHTCPSATPIRPCAAMRAKRTLSAAQPAKESERRDSAHPFAGDTLDADAFAFQPTALIPHPATDTDTDVDSSSPQADDICPTSTTHPYQTLNIHTPCLPCQRRRTTLLERLEAEKGAVRFEDWRWKVRYRVSGEGFTEERTSGGGSPEARSSLEWGKSVGEAMGSWVRKRGEEVRRVLGEEGLRGGVGSM